MSELDYSLPLSDLLRTGTAKAHHDAHNSPGGIALANGKLEKDEYIRFLMMMFYVYSTFERALEQHSSHPTLHSTFNPTLLARAPSIEADISFLLQVPESAWMSHPINTALVSSPPPEFTRYIARLEALSAAPDPSPLLAHAYVRYLGDLSGGQFVRRCISKAYGIDDADGSGVRFYAFKQLIGNKEGNIGDFKKIKQWYSVGMNAGVGVNQQLKATIVEEANLAFELNTAILSILQIPVNSPSESPSLLDEDLEEISSETSKEPPYASPDLERVYSVATVTSIVIAVCLAHFLLVVGGFTGASGFAKLDALEAWLAGTWGQLTGFK